jgi:ammonium transporter
MNLSPIDQLWLLTCSGLLLLMQAGFLCLEAGLTRCKNAVNVALKNLVDLTLTPLVYVAVGAGLMFGASWSGVIGLPWTFGNEATGALATFLLFQTLFCASATTIVSGAVAERMRLGAYAAVCCLIAAVIYPLVGHWVWGGVWSGEPGWLKAIGFDDFAGSGVVHVTGGFAALAGAIALGPRLGRFSRHRAAMSFPKNNLPLAMLGAMLLAVGWVGFNGGSALGFNDSVGPVVLNTLMAGAAGGAAALGIARLRGPVISPEIIINGLLAGLVAICASANTATPSAAVVVGVCASVAAMAAASLLTRCKVDDVVGAFPVHGVGGLVGLLLQPFTPGAEGGFGEFVIQAIGGGAISMTSFVLVYVLLAMALPRSWVRVSAREERLGLSMSANGVVSELQTLRHSLVQTDPTTAAGAIRINKAGIDGADIDRADDAGALAAALQERVSQAFQEGEASSTAELVSQHATELRGYGEFLLAVLDGVDLQICILDEAGNIVETNLTWDKFAHSAGVADRAKVGASFQELCLAGKTYDKDSAEQIVEAVTQIAAGGGLSFHTECRVQLSDSERCFEIKVRPLPAHERGAVIVTQLDRTKERQAQELILQEKHKAECLADALEASQAALDLAMKAAELGLWHWDIATGYFELSADWLERIGIDELRFHPDISTLRNLLPPEELTLWTPEDASSVADDEPYDRQFRLRRPDGSYRWVQVLGRAVSMTEQGTPECLTGILIDIDARKSAELRDAGMAKIIEESNKLLFVCDRKTKRFIEVNRGARENLGYSIEELRGMTPYDITPADLHAEVGKRISDLASGVATRTDFETVHVRRDGTTYPALLTVQPARLLERDVYVAIGSDMSQRLELERQLADARRLESIGQLAAGVAHEMNTPLQFVENNIEFLQQCSSAWFEVFNAFEELLDPTAPPQSWRDRQTEFRELLERVRFDHIRKETPKAIADCHEGVNRVLQIVRAMKDFSHPGEHRHTLTDLNRGLSSTVTVTRNRWKLAGELTLDLDPYLPHVECQGSSINQVFVNLIVNAADAIIERHEHDPLAPAGLISVRSYTDGESAVFEFADNGSGMPQEVQRRAFDPFFTTKEVGKGTGQGLSLCHTIIVKAHHGAIDVESTPGAGTLLRVRLPLKQVAADAYTIHEQPVEHFVV